MPKKCDIPRACASCGETFLASEYKLSHGIGRYCSRRCSNDARMLSVEERFWPKVRKTESCWEWIGARVPFGYGLVGRGGRRGNRLAHRVSWELTNGTIPEGLCVLHHCDNPGCVRPSHLWLGTRTDNNRDMYQKGRDVNTQHPGMCPLGEAHGNAKLTLMQVLEIRSRYEAGEHGLSALAAEFGVHKVTIWRIANRREWKHAQ